MALMGQYNRNKGETPGIKGSERNGTASKGLDRARVWLGGGDKSARLGVGRQGKATSLPRCETENQTIGREQRRLRSKPTEAARQ